MPHRRLDLIHTSPLILKALIHQIEESTALRVATASTSWAQFTTAWDFAAPGVVVDAHLDDHLPLAVKVRALRQAGSRVAVLGRGADSRLAERARREGATLWLEPSTSVEVMAPLIAGWFTSRTREPSPEDVAPELTDRESQVLALYASRRALSVGVIGQTLGLSPETIRTHLRTGRAKYSAAGHAVGSRALLETRLVADGLLDPPQVWAEMRRW